MRFLELIAAVVVGGMIPTILFFLEKRWDARSRAYNWFVERFIEGSTDALHEFFGRWALLSSLPARDPRELLKNPAFTEVPHQGISRLSAITGGVSFQNWFNAMRGSWLRAAHRGDWSGLSTFQTQAASICEHLNTLRRDLLAQKVKRKADVYKLRKLPCVACFNDALSGMTDQLTQDPNVTTYPRRQEDAPPQ